MSDFNSNLKSALSADDEAFLRSLDDEPGLFAQLGNAFHGKMKFWTSFAFVMSFLIFGLGVYCFVQLWNAEGSREQILWATGVLLSMQSVGLFKIWFWMRMNHLVALREVKKLELYLAKGAE